MKKGSRLVCFLLLCFWITGCQREEHCINRKQALEEKMNLCTVPPTETPSVSNTLQMTPLPKLTPIPGTTVAPPLITMLPEQTSPGAQEEETVDITICFTGDISLAEDAPTMKQWENSGKNLEQCISPELLFLMNAADVLCMNNEFTFTTRGTPLADKTYTFRANPERVALLLEMGVDVALLANNHVYDYGKVSLLDTLDTLEAAGIAYFGAGRNLAEAMQPYYVEVDGITIAFVAASRAEKNRKTPQATETEPGILRCYETDLFLEVIREADANADLVLACVHWGTEYSTVLEEEQLTTGKLYLDAGADAIIGSHSHCLQGLEIYDGKPIIYSLGNFWFNTRTLDTMLLQLHITGNKDKLLVETEIIPARQENNCTHFLAELEEQQEVYEYLERISINVEIDEQGTVKEKQETP